ncbi:MAG: DUF5610 domain-containing protein, partial [Shewanella sp.]
MEINKSPQVQNTLLSHKKHAEDTQSKGAGVNDSTVVKATEVTTKQTVQQTSKNLMNQAILSAQQEVNIKSGDQSMMLLYRAAIESINKELAPTMGENAIQTAYDNGIDTSPEATADRIVSFAT